MPSDDLGILRLIQQGATWDKATVKNFAQEANLVCDNCGALNPDFNHVSWTCSGLDEQRRVLSDQLLPGLDHCCLPPSLLSGVAPRARHEA